MISESFNNETVLLVSIKPEYAELIFEGKKTVELRKCIPQRAKNGTLMLIYVTSPVKELWGICRIGNILKDKPLSLWEKIGRRSGISKNEYFEYYGESQIAYGIEIDEVINFDDRTIRLDILRKIIPGFNPPQTYKYLSPDLLKIIDFDME